VIFFLFYMTDGGAAASVDLLLAADDVLRSAGVSDDVLRSASVTGETLEPF
jgi:hypothetical protein